MARCGETLFLRCFSANSLVKVVFQLRSSGQPFESNAFYFFKNYSSLEIDSEHEVVKPYGISSERYLLLKQGIWKHPYPFRGIILIRNPYSVYLSLKRYELSSANPDWRENWKRFRLPRLLAWVADMNLDLYRSIEKSNDPIEQFFLFYSWRFLDLISLGLPIVRYEDLVEDPRKWLEYSCNVLGVTFSESMLDSHLLYEKCKDGHGGNKLDLPIHRDSVYSYKEKLSLEELKKIYSGTESLCAMLGYESYA